MQKLSCLLGAICLIAAPLRADDHGSGEWIDLFDGKSIDSWIQRGGKAEYSVKDGAIVGVAVPNTLNSFLCPDLTVGDFILEYEFQIDPSLNCGVQIRSNSTDSYKDGRVHGYQSEIDPSHRGWTAGIFDEARRGWLDSHVGNEPARYAIRQNDWNKVRVEFIGDRVCTYLNGVPAADLVDAMTQTGFIGFQVHGVGKRDDRPWVKYRGIRMKDLGTSEWKPAFNGKDLTGFHESIAGKWSVEDGILVGKTTKDEERHPLLFLDEAQGDFTVRITYKNTQGNSGLYFRAKKTDKPAGIFGYQAEIDSKGKSAGGLYFTGGGGWVVKPEQALADKAYLKDDWNVMVVSAHGRRIVTQLNNQTIAEIKHDEKSPESGLLALQLHGKQDVEIHVKSIEFLHTPTDYRSPVQPAPAPTPASLVKEGAEFVKLADGFKFTEGPALGSNGKIYFNDIPNETTHVYDPASGETSVARKETGRANGIFFEPTGTAMVCEGGSRAVTRWSVGGEAKTVVSEFEGKKLNSPNDIAPDGAGGYFFTDPRYGNRDDMELNFEGLYYLPRKGKLALLDKELSRPNGVILSPDEKTLYVADTELAQVFAYDVDGGKVSNKRVFAEEGSDGMSVDTNGNIYLTWKGEILAFSPEGKELLRIAPPEKPANCLLVGSTLYVTARTGFYSLELNTQGIR